MIEKPGINALADHLFRHEYGKLVSILVRTFGPAHLEFAEDVVQDSLVEAISHWSYEGVPDNPAAWLFRVAKNKALNIINREKYKSQYASDAMYHFQSEDLAENSQYPFSQQEILDDQLRMIFTCCHGSISVDSQIALALKTLCGFSISEIARAFLTTGENINKRLVRARQTLRENKILFEVPQGPALEKRLKAVLETIYLLFNEGYSASQGRDIIRYDLCEEAIRLVEIIAQHPAIREKSEVCGLLALMQLNASRFNARLDNQGNLLSLAEQDRSIWDKELVAKGIANLQASIDSRKISGYQLLAMISAQHCMASDFASTNWISILSLYDNLVEIDSSPIILLNRAVAIAKVKGAEKALVELERLKDDPLIRDYHLFYLTTAEIEIELERFSRAIANLGKAFQLVTQSAEKNFIRKRIEFCKGKLVRVS